MAGRDPGDSVTYRARQRPSPLASCRRHGTTRGRQTTCHYLRKEDRFHAGRRLCMEFIPKLWNKRRSRASALCRRLLDFRRRALLRRWTMAST